MAWEQRGNGRYYYQKRREGNRIISEYIGSVLFAEAIATLKQLDRLESERMQHQWQETLEAEQVIDQQLINVAVLVRALKEAPLLANGCHAHKRQWRRSKNE